MAGPPPWRVFEMPVGYLNAGDHPQQGRLGFHLTLYKRKNSPSSLNYLRQAANPILRLPIWHLKIVESTKPPAAGPATGPETAPPAAPSPPRTTGWPRG